MSDNLKPCKVSGGEAVLQTRQEDHEKFVAENPKASPPQLVRPGDIAFSDQQGNRIQVRDEDVNVNDVRAICHESGRATPWNKPNKVEDVVRIWNEINNEVPSHVEPKRI